ncbi:MAG: hypothetical protein ABJN95_15855 [Maribacter sp.]|uniref:hypothetical protein n=1 Tax=Maribacter sp. TaxID=1897614 RepID=UPI0032973299
MKSGTKNIVLATGFAFFLFLVYKFAISPTLMLKATYSDLVKEDQLYQNSPKQISNLLRRQQEYDSILLKMNLGSSSMENNLLRILNLQAEGRNMKVMDFNDPHIFENNGSPIHTFDFTLEGNFTDLLKTIYVVEQKNNLGEIAHLHFRKQKDFKTNKNFLTLRVFVQQVK